MKTRPITSTQSYSR